jgi:DNA-binding GntR family transcriptional regulator
MSLTELSPAPIPVRFQPGEVASLSEQAYGAILGMMLSGTLPPGTVLHERRLAESMAMSRTPVREALGRLEAESLVTRMRGRAPMVADVSIENYMMLLDMRRMLEIECAARAATRMPRAEAEAVIAAIEDLVADPDPSPAKHWGVDDLVHLSLADAAGNPLVASTIRDLRRRTRIFNAARIPKRLLPGASEHLELLAAIIAHEPDTARALMGRHIDNVRDAIIEYLIGAKRRS